MKKTDDIAVLKTYPDFPGAEKDRLTLENNGIESFITEEAYSAIFTGQSGEYSLSVRATDRL